MARCLLELTVIFPMRKKIILKIIRVCILYKSPTHDIVQNIVLGFISKNEVPSIIKWRNKMSVWWEFEFSVAGPVGSIANLKIELPNLLFDEILHSVEIEYE